MKAFPEADLCEPAALCTGLAAAVALIASGLPWPISRFVALAAVVVGLVSLVAVLLGHAQAMSHPRPAPFLWTAAAYLVFAGLAWATSLWTPWPSAVFGVGALVALRQASRARKAPAPAPPPKAS